MNWGRGARGWGKCEQALAPEFDLFERVGEDFYGVVELGFGGCGGRDEA